MERQIVLMPCLDILQFLPFLLYAETHYRFPFLPSFLRKREPEILADAPHRVEPGKKLPVLILVKDADQFPCNLQQVALFLRQGDVTLHREEHLRDSMKLEARVHAFVISIDVSAFRGWIELDVLFTLDRAGVKKHYYNDNYRTSSHKPLRVYVAEDPLPRFPDLHLGDPHVHSLATCDQVEFGSPLSESVELARSMGLSFFCVTDHSYDLDDRIDSFLQNDPTLPKWHLQQAEVSALNRTNPDFVVVPGEEVSCRNSDGKNIHLLLFGQREFIHGSGDSAELWLRTRSEHSVKEVIGLGSRGAVAFAAHAKESVPFLQSVLLGRGEWTERDLTAEGMTGLQVFNGKHDGGSRDGFSSWVTHLQAGRRLVALAGNDAHGNFNRFRQIGIPFLSLREKSYHLFGKMRTGVFIDGHLSEEGILEALRHGRAIMTDGPVASISFNASRGKDSSEQLPSHRALLDVAAKSTEEFGELHSIRLVVGSRGETEERMAYRIDDLRSYEFRREFPLDQEGWAYVRLEVETRCDGTADGEGHFCCTNPLWQDESG